MIPPDQIEKRRIAKDLLGCELSPSATTDVLKAYFQYYISVTSPSTAESSVITVDNAALKSHDDILRCVKIICENPTFTRDQFVAAAFTRDSTPKENDHATVMVVKAAFMVDIASGEFLSQLLLDEVPGVKWDRQQRFLDFLLQSFPCDRYRTADKAREIREALRMQKSLRAWKLLKRCGIKIKGTDDLFEHLLYNSREKSIKVFHHVGFLQSHLRISRGESLELEFEPSLRLNTLPPRLLLETLVSFHSILFPIATIKEKRSRSLLKYLIQNTAFDEDGMWMEYVREIPPNFTFLYWGDRILRLYELTKHPPPANALIAWFERHTSERNALTVAIVGLFLAVLFGFLGVIIGILQLVLAWVAWKYPV